MSKTRPEDSCYHPNLLKIEESLGYDEAAKEYGPLSVYAEFKYI